MLIKIRFNNISPYDDLIATGRINSSCCKLLNDIIFIVLDNRFRDVELNYLSKSSMLDNIGTLYTGKRVLNNITWK